MKITRNSVSLMLIVLMIAGGFMLGISAVAYVRVQRQIADYQQRDWDKIPESRPFLCLVPYNLDYCHAHQDQMYREQAARER